MGFEVGNELAMQTWSGACAGRAGEKRQISAAAFRDHEHGDLLAQPQEQLSCNILVAEINHQRKARMQIYALW